MQGFLICSTRENMCFPSEESSLFRARKKRCFRFYAADRKWRPGQEILGDIQHLLVGCCALQHKRDDIYNYWNKQTQQKLNLQKLLQSMTANSSRNFCQFLLDPSVVPEVIRGCQEDLFSLNDIFPLTNTFAYAIHRRRLQMIGRFNIV